MQVLLLFNINAVDVKFYWIYVSIHLITIISKLNFKISHTQFLISPSKAIITTGIICFLFFRMGRQYFEGGCGALSLSDDWTASCPSGQNYFLLQNCLFLILRKININL